MGTDLTVLRAMAGWPALHPGQRAACKAAIEEIEAARKVHAHETDELLSIVRDISTMDCFWSASGHHEADCKCLSGRAERAVAAHTQKAEVGASLPDLYSACTGEPHDCPYIYCHSQLKCAKQPATGKLP